MTPKIIGGWNLKKFLKVVLALVASLGFIFCVLVYALIASGSNLYETRSPSNQGTAIFYSGFDPGGESDKNLFVRDYSKSGRKPIFVDVVSEGERGPALGDVVWSDDGTIIAFNYATAGGKVGMTGYDFQTHTKIYSKSISQALAQRDGEGPIVVSGGYELRQISRHPWPWELIAFDK